MGANVVRGGGGCSFSITVHACHVRYTCSFQVCMPLYCTYKAGFSVDNDEGTITTYSRGTYYAHNMYAVL